MNPVLLPRSFYERPPQWVARELLGARLVRVQQNVHLVGMIIEAEAYDGESDLACHARAGLTPRTRVMYGPAGFSYVYFTYGVHWMLNAVTGVQGYPSAVLIRGIVPLEGLGSMESNRPRPKSARDIPLHPPLTGIQPRGWTDGPACLTQALHITGSENGLDLCDPSGSLWIEPGITIPDDLVASSPRIGISNVPEPWRSLPWRFYVKIGENRTTSRGKNKY